MHSLVANCRDATHSLDMQNETRSTNAEQVAEWLRSRLTADQLADVVAGRVLAGDIVDIPADWPEEVVMEGIEMLAVTPSQLQSLARIGYRVTGVDAGNVYLTGNGEGVMCPLSGIADFIAEMTPKN